MSNTPPFEMPGHRWDPVKKRFFKILPGETLPKTKAKDKKEKQQQVDFPSCSSSSSSSQLSSVFRYNAALDLVSLRASGRVTLQLATRIDRDAKIDLFSKFKLSHKISLRQNVYQQYAGHESISSICSTQDGKTLIVLVNNEDLWAIDNETRETTLLVSSYNGYPDFLDVRNKIHFSRLSNLLYSTKSGNGKCVVTSHLVFSSSDTLRIKLELMDVCTIPVKADLFCSALWEDQAIRKGWNNRIALGIGKSVFLINHTARGELQSQGIVFKSQSDVMAICFDVSGETLFIGHRSGELHSITIATSKTESKGIHENGAVTNISTVSEHDILIAWSNGKVKLMDTDLKETKFSIEGHQNDYMQGLGFDILSLFRLVVLSGQDGKVRIWSLPFSKPLEPRLNNNNNTEAKFLSQFIFQPCSNSIHWVQSSLTAHGTDRLNHGSSPLLVIASATDLYYFHV